MSEHQGYHFMQLKGIRLRPRNRIKLSPPSEADSRLQFTHMKYVMDLQTKCNITNSLNNKVGAYKLCSQLEWQNCGKIQVIYQKSSMRANQNLTIMLSICRLVHPLFSLYNPFIYSLHSYLYRLYILRNKLHYLITNLSNNMLQ